MFLFVLGIVVAMSQARIRERVRKVLGEGYGRLRGTVGMGTKVSYI
jgi:hypothetical protein